MSVNMRYMDQRNCTKRNISKESHLVFKKNNPLLVKNFRPVRVLPAVSTIMGRIMQKQIIDYINQYILPCYVGLEKASLHKWLCFNSLKNGTLCLIKAYM